MSEITFSKTFLEHTQAWFSCSRFLLATNEEKVNLKLLSCLEMISALKIISIRCKECAFKNHKTAHCVEISFNDHCSDCQLFTLRFHLVTLRDVRNAVKHLHIAKMELLLSEYLTLGNIFLVIVFLLILNQLIELYSVQEHAAGTSSDKFAFYRKSVEL